MQKDNKTKSLHYYHFFGVLDRIKIDKLSDKVPLLSDIPTQEMARSLLPSKSDDRSLIKNINVLFSRILNESLSFFNTAFGDLIINHIHHRHYSEISFKSVVVSYYNNYHCCPC